MSGKRVNQDLARKCAYLLRVAERRFLSAASVL